MTVHNTQKFSFPVSPQNVWVITGTRPILSRNILAKVFSIEITKILVPWLRSCGDEIFKADRHVVRLLFEHMVCCFFFLIFNLLLHLQYVTRVQASAPYQWHTQVLISLSEALKHQQKYTV